MAASSLRVAATTILRSDAFEVLMLKRGFEAKFMPNSFVFPGGILEPQVDSMFPEKKTNFDDSSPGITLGLFETDLPLRVAAARELFEEAGLLLTYDPHTRECKAVTSDDDKSLLDWRIKVRNDARAFSDLFGQHMFLDVASLVPWSNWLTPMSYKKRFDTVFFVVPLKGATSAIEFCEREMQGAKWDIPSNFIRRACSDEKLALPPPQFYELARLRMINSNEPEQLARMTNQFKICPQIARNKDNLGKRMTLLPGDHLFDWEKRFEGLPVKDVTAEDMKMDENLPVHRITFDEDPIYTNLELHFANIDKMSPKAHLFWWKETVEEERKRFLHEILHIQSPRTTYV